MNPDVLLNYLKIVSNETIYLNLTMHVLTFLAVVAIYFIRFSKIREIAFNCLLFILPTSVTVVAFINKNPFHLVTFAILSIVTFVEIIIGKNKVETPTKNSGTALSAAFLLLGIWYPEFVNANHFFQFFISPLGIIPCPTLIVILSMLALNRHGISKREHISAITIGAVYALIGVFVLKVYLDVILLILVFYSIYIIVDKSKTSMPTITNQQAII